MLGRVVNPFIDVLDVDGIVQRIDVNELLQRIDINELLQRVDWDECLGKLIYALLSDPFHLPNQSNLEFFLSHQIKLTSIACWIALMSTS